MSHLPDPPKDTALITSKPAISTQQTKQRDRVPGLASTIFGQRRRDCVQAKSVKPQGRDPGGEAALNPWTPREQRAGLLAGTRVWPIRCRLEFVSQATSAGACLSSGSTGSRIATAWATYRVHTKLQSEAMLQTKIRGWGEGSACRKSLLRKLKDPSLIFKPILKNQARGVHF